MSDPFFLGVPTLCRHDLLTICIDSALASTRLPHLIFVIDNGGGFTHPDGRVRVINPPENLGIARSWNLLHKLTYPHQLFISNDDIRFADDTFACALATPGPFVAVCGYACFLCREEAWAKVGEFDEFFTAYHEDNDHAWRLRCSGLELFTPTHGAVEHVGSATIKGLPAVHRETVNRYYEQGRAYYRRKWGGLPGEEKFRVAFNGEAK